MQIGLMTIVTDQSMYLTVRPPYVWTWTRKDIP
jgi:hypothetical protein